MKKIIEKINNKQWAILSLAILIPLPSLGVLFGMILFPNTMIGATIFFSCKVALLAIPIIWLKLINKHQFTLSPAKQGGFLVSGLIGLVMSGIIFFAYYSLGPLLIDPVIIQETMNDVGLANKLSYLACVLYWVLINSILEEYVWRWFVVSQAEKIGSVPFAIVLSAIGFILHHALAMSLYFNIVSVLLCSVAVFIAGLFWSWCYVKYRSIWPCYVSHAIVDIAIFYIGKFYCTSKW